MLIKQSGPHNLVQGQDQGGQSTVKYQAMFTLYEIAFVLARKSCWIYVGYMICDRFIDEVSKRLHYSATHIVLREIVFGDPVCWEHLCQKPAIFFGAILEYPPRDSLIGLVHMIPE